MTIFLCFKFRRIIFQQTKATKFKIQNNSTNSILLIRFYRYYIYIPYKILLNIEVYFTSVKVIFSSVCDEFFIMFLSPFKSSAFPRLLDFDIKAISIQNLLIFYKGQLMLIVISCILKGKPIQLA